MGTPALYTRTNTVVDVIQDGDEMAYVKFPDKKVLWVKSGELDFDSVAPVEEDPPFEPFDDRGDDYYDYHYWDGVYDYDDFYDPICDPIY